MKTQNEIITTQFPDLISLITDIKQLQMEFKTKMIKFKTDIKQQQTVFKRNMVELETDINQLYVDTAELITDMNRLHDRMKLIDI